MGREEIFLLPPFPCLLPPLSIHRLRPSPSLVFFPESKQGREVFLSPSRWKRGKWVADLGGGERSKVKAEEAALKKEAKKQTSLLGRRLLQGNGGGARGKSPFSSASVTLLPVCAWRGKKAPPGLEGDESGGAGKAWLSSLKTERKLDLFPPSLFLTEPSPRGFLFPLYPIVPPLFLLPPLLFVGLIIQLFRPFPPLSATLSLPHPKPLRRELE